MKELNDFEVATKFKDVQDLWAGEQKEKGLKEAATVLEKVRTSSNIAGTTRVLPSHIMLSHEFRVAQACLKSYIKCIDQIFRE